MDVSGIGVQTIAPTTGTSPQNQNSNDRANDSSNTSSQRVNPTPPAGTGTIVDKRV
jgi:hypothetical protein